MTSLDDNFKLIDLLFKENKTLFDKNEIKDSEELISKGILKEQENNPEVLKLTPNEQFFEFVLNFIEKETVKQFPNDILSAFKFIDEFKEQKRKENGINIINAYEEVILGLKMHVLHKFREKEGADPKEIFFSIEDLDSSEHYLNDFERTFFRFLPYSDYTIDEIAEIVIHVGNKELRGSSLIDFLRGYGKISIEDANKLLNTLKESNSHSRIISNLLIGLYNAGDINKLDLVIDLKNTNLVESLFVLGRIDYSGEKEIEKVFGIIEPLNYSNKVIASDQSYLLFHLINCDKVTINILEKSFGLLIEFLDKGTPEIVDDVFHGITHYLDNNEAEKYELLKKYLSKTSNFDVIKRFFSNFKNPVYVFDLMMRSFSGNPNYRFPIDIFQEGIQHAWKKNNEETERLILHLFNQHPAFSILAVKVILSAHNGVYNVDLLKLREKEAQINAIKGLCKSPIFFDKLLPILLELRKSEFDEVVELLQKELAEKVFYSYQETIYEIIVKEINDSKEDKAFIKPIKKALDSYVELKKLKESIKDIDPIENESDLMELYYRLENEEKAKMMNKIHEGEGTFLEFVKNTVIVRGNSWKIGDREVSPLGNIESKILIDGSSYLNPELFEKKINSI